MATAAEKIAGSGGCKLLTAGTYSNVSFESLVINSDAVISAIEIKNVDALTAFGFSGQTLKSGCYVSTVPDQKITKITIDSGTIMAYN